MKKISSVAWSTNIDNSRVNLNYVECFLLSLFYEHTKDVGGLAGISAQVILDSAKEFFGDIPTLFDVIDAAKEHFERRELIVVKKHARSGVWVYPTQSLVSVASRLAKHVSSVSALVHVVRYPSQDMFNGAYWHDAEDSDDESTTP